MLLPPAYEGAPAPGADPGAPTAAAAPAGDLPGASPVVTLEILGTDGRTTAVPGVVIDIAALASRASAGTGRHAAPGGPGHASGAAGPVAGRSAVVLPLGALTDALAIQVRSGPADGQRLDRVLAVEPALQLALVGAPGGVATAGLAPPGDAAALYLGAQARLLDASGREMAVRIDSPPTAGVFGAYHYALAAERSPGPGPAALVDGERRLLGIAAPEPWADGGQGVPLVALDASALSAMLNGSLSSPLQSVEEFCSSWFEEAPAGRLLLAEAAARRGERGAVLDLLTPLANLGPPWGDIARPMLEAAWQGEVLAAMDRGRDDGHASNLLEEAAATLGWNSERRLLAARLQRLQGDVPGALRSLRAGWREAVAAGSPQADTLLRAARRLLDEALAGQSLHGDAMIALLREQLQLDPRYAPYHAALGRLLYGLGRYGEALPPLYRARELDPARFVAALAGPIEQAEQRAMTPGLTVVPVHSEGATLYVHARIPGSPLRYRFILDTGASITAVSPDVLAGLRNVRPRRSVDLQTANGTVQAPLVTIPGLDVAGARVSDLDVVVLESLSGFDGLLGLSYLDHFNIDLDRNRGELTLRLR